MSRRIRFCCAVGNVIDSFIRVRLSVSLVALTQNVQDGFERSFVVCGTPPRALLNSVTAIIVRVTPLGVAPETCPALVTDGSSTGKQ
jgi:hypothetical protein